MSTRHSERRVVKYQPAQLLDLVADVPRYPEFLPWCFVKAPDDPAGPRIDTTGIEGPFRLLKSRWIFRPHPEGSEIDFELEFDFRSLLLQKTVQLLFAEAVRRMVSAFEARAAKLYGKPIAAVTQTPLPR